MKVSMKLSMKQAAWTLFLLSFLTPYQIMAEVIQLSIQQALQTAVTQDTELQFMHRTYVLDMQNRALQILSLMPSIRVSYSDSQTINTGSTDSFVKQLSIEANQVLYNNGQYIRAAKKARENRSVEAQRILKKKQQTAYSMLQTIVTYLLLQQEQRIHQQTIENAEKQLRIAQEERKTGVITEVQLVNVTLQISELQLKKAERAEALTEARFALNKHLRFSPESQIIIHGSLNESYTGFLQQETAQYYFEIAQSKNTELVQQRYTAAHAKRELRASYFQWIPTVSLTVTAAFHGTDFPLTRPSFRTAILARWDTFPVSAQTSLSVQQQQSSRTLASKSSTVVGETGTLSQKGKRLHADKAHAVFRQNMNTIYFHIIQALEKIAIQKQRLQLLRDRASLEERKKTYTTCNGAIWGNDQSAVYTIGNNPCGTTNTYYT